MFESNFFSENGKADQRHWSAGQEKYFRGAIVTNVLTRMNLWVKPVRVNKNLFPTFFPTKKFVSDSIGVARFSVLQHTKTGKIYTY
jgi:hypothetical protein